MCIVSWYVRRNMEWARSMRIYTSPWLYAEDMEIDMLATLVENFEKCPPLDRFLDTRLRGVIWQGDTPQPRMGYEGEAWACSGKYVICIDFMKVVTMPRYSTAVQWRRVCQCSFRSICSGFLKMNKDTLEMLLNQNLSTVKTFVSMMFESLRNDIKELRMRNLRKAWHSHKPSWMKYVKFLRNWWTSCNIWLNRRVLLICRI